MIKQDSFILLWMENLNISNFFDPSLGNAFERLDLRLDSGDYAAISGIYGTDKISFINVLGCLSRPKGGKYIFDYNDITTIGNEQLDSIRSRNIGFVFKGLNIIDNISVYKNIELPLVHDSSLDGHKMVFEVAERLGLTDVLHKNARELSELQQHKVAIARALVVKPILILADEPGEGLSKSDASIIMDILNDINKAGTAIIAFSDKEEVINKAARHIVFEKGEIKKDSKLYQCNVKEGAI